MRLFKKWVMTAILVCGACVFTSCTNKAKQPSLKEELRALYGENKKITDGNYDRSLAVKCINGTFVGRKTNNVIAFKGIPFVG
jgi:para-nitrobenzyl esterase